MKVFNPVKAIAVAVVCTSALFPVGTSVAVAAPSPAGAGAGAEGEGAAAIMMGVAIAASTQTIDQQRNDRAALMKRLQHLVDTKMFVGHEMNVTEDMSRIVRIVFDVGPDGRTTNVRIGKRSGSGSIDRNARLMVGRFNDLPGGERLRVCAVLQYGHRGQDPADAVYVKARTDATASAIADLIAGRDGPSYDRHGRII